MLRSHPVACGILVPQSRMEPTPLALEGEVLTTGLPGKPLVTANLKVESQGWPKPYLVEGKC